MDSKKQALDYFDRHPNSIECHVSADGRVFHTLPAAQGYASGLRNTAVASFKRAELEQQDASDALSLEVNLDESEVTLENFDPAHKDAYLHAKALVDQYDLKPETGKKQHLIAAIEAFKAAQSAE